MISNHRKKREIIISLALATAACLIFASFASAQTDPFYIRLLEKAQKSFLVKEYTDAAQQFEIAAFGLASDKTLQAKAYIYLGLCRYYLKDTSSSEKYLRDAADLVGEKEFENLQIAESAWPDLEKLLISFKIREAPKEAASQALSTADKPVKAKRDEPKKSAKKPPEKAAQKVSTAPPEPPQITLDNLKEGDLLPLDMVETRPLVLERVSADYPSAARSFKIEGTVLINALISEKGDVIKTEIITGIKGAFGFNQSAQRAVRQWKFEPATIKGIKVKVWMPVAIVFKFQEPT
jgi:TonB family protein